MKIVTRIELVVVSDRDVALWAPVVGSESGKALNELDYYLRNVRSSRAVLEIAKVDQCNKAANVEDEWDVFESFRKDWEDFHRLRKRLELRLDEVDEEEAGEWMLVADRLPPLTVLGLCSPVCIVKQVGGASGIEAVYHNGGYWTTPSGEDKFDVVGFAAINAWRKKPGISYEEPEDRYAQVERENNEKLGRMPGMENFY